jgi:hypothetical protein
MTTHNDCELALRKAVRELQAVPAIQISVGELEDEAPSDLSPAQVENDIREGFGTNLPQSVTQCSVAYEQISYHWWIDHSEGSASGEFNLRPPCTCLPAIPPSAEWVMSDSERELSDQFLLFDDFPQGGTDPYVALRLDSDTRSPEIWYHATECGPLLLDLDYCTYLRTLAITKGALGWHFLFADISLKQADFRSYINELKGMLAVFPELFPEYDYTSLQERLEARL